MDNEMKLLMKGITLGAFCCSVAVAILFYSVSMWGIMTVVEFVQSVYTMPLLIGAFYLIAFTIPNRISKNK